MPTILDWTIVLTLALPLPFLAYLGYRRLVRQVAAGDPHARLRAYHRTTLIQWLVVAGLIAYWLGVGRPLSDLGFRAGEGGRHWIALGLCVAAGALLVWQERNVRSRSAARESVRRQLEPMAGILPQTAGELGAFVRLSITAGVCEEIVYRGYLIWLLSHLGGVWVALVASALLFGLGHLYQGVASVGKIFAIGLVLGGLYLLAGALWAPILLHVLIDVTSGRTAFAALTGGEEVGGRRDE